MRLRRNRRGQTVTESQRERGESTERHWHLMEILIEATDADADRFFDRVANAAFNAEPEGSDAHISAQSRGVSAPGESRVAS